MPHFGQFPGLSLSTPAHIGQKIFARTVPAAELRRLLMRVVEIVQVSLWPVRLAEELLAAMLAAKVEGLAVPLGAASGRFIDRHAANGVNCHNWCSLSHVMQLNDDRSSKTSSTPAGSTITHVFPRVKEERRRNVDPLMLRHKVVTQFVNAENQQQANLR